MSELTSYLSEEQKIRFLNFANDLIFQELPFSSKIQNLCAELDAIHQTHTTFTVVDGKRIQHISSQRFDEELELDDGQLYKQLLQDRTVIEWRDLEHLSLHRDTHSHVTNQGFNAHYYIPIFNEKNSPIGYFICYFNQNDNKHRNIFEFNKKIKKIVRFIYKIQLYQTQIEQLTFVDADTNLPSYKQFLEIIERYKTQNKTGVIKIVEPGEFSKVVELFGRPAGVAMLKELGKRLKRLSASENSDVARFTSSSLIMFTPIDFLAIGKTGKVPIMEAANEPFIIKGQQIYTTLKIGIAPFEKDHTGYDAIRFAESALTDSKVMPGTQTNFYIEQSNRNSERELLLLNHLKKALQDKQITAHFQPKFEIRKGRIASMEALARWISPELGFISPGEFIPVAESSGLIRELELQIIEQVLKWQQERQYDGKRIVPIAINISPEHFYHPLFIPKLKSLIQQYYADPHFLIIEITESMSLFDFERAKIILTKLRLLGISTSMDDFGIGYSSLSYLQKFSFDELKIDQSFSQKINEIATQTIVRSIIQIAHMLEMIVIVEGVETLEQSNILKDLKCDVIQGYYYSRPLPIEGASKLLDRQIHSKKNYINY